MSHQNGIELQDAFVSRELPKVIVEPEVKKSDLDSREFRAISLSNGLKVLLVSDLSTDKAAAAMNVGVGHFSDPWNLPGLAHFCEHMLFLGTEKYPDEGSYMKFLSENSGFSNAYTSMENTNYHFQLVLPPNDLENPSESHVPRFKEALDRFSQFFTAPLFTESATDRELSAVDSEHQKNLQSDGNRLFQLRKSCANPKHPFSKFSTGSEATLKTDAIAAGIDIREQLLEFHSKFYSANLMHLCIAAPHNLDILQQWVTELFSEIPNHDAQHPSEEYKALAPLLPENMAHMLYVDTIKDIRLLEIAWVIPSTFLTYKTKPYYYVTLLVNHEGKGSLLSVLKKKGWVNNLYAEAFKETSTFSIFEVSIELTEEGVHHTDEIIGLIFGYLAMIKEGGVQKWIFEEASTIASMRFRFQESPEPYGLVRLVSGSMQKHAPAEYISAIYLYEEYDPAGIHEILECLVPHCANIIIAGKFTQQKTNREEKWYKTKYGIEPFNAEQIKRWVSAATDKALALPAPNPFIPTNFSMLMEALPTNKKDMTGPKLVEKNSFFELHYKLDRTFNRPKAVVSLDLQTPLAYMSPRHSMLTKIFAYLMTDELSEFSYDADAAGLFYDFNNTAKGIRLICHGFNDRLDMLLNAIIERMSKFKVNPDRYGMIVDQITREMRNFEKDQPFRHAMYNLAYLTEQPRWHVKQYLNCLESKSITADDVDNFVPELLSRVYVVGLVVGNVTEEWSKETMTSVRSTIGFSSLAPEERRVIRVGMLPTDCDVLSRLHHTNVDDHNSAIEVMFQLGPRGDYKKDVKIELLSDILNEATFHELRTVQQLGYMVFESMSRSQNVRVLYIIVQSTVAGPDELRNRIEKFLIDVRKNNLERISDKEFAVYVESLMALKADRERGLYQQAMRFSSEISCGDFHYDRAEKEIEALKTISKADVLDAFDKYIAATGTERRCIVSMVYGNQHAMPEGTVDGIVTSSDGKRKTLEVIDAVAFRNLCPLYPVSGSSVEKVCDLGGPFKKQN